MTCGKCRFLDKSRVLKGNDLNPIMYGCNKRRRGYVVGWIRKDKELNEMGCSDFEERKENEQLSLF